VGGRFRHGTATKSTGGTTRVESRLRSVRDRARRTVSHGLTPTARRIFAHFPRRSNVHSSRTGGSLKSAKRCAALPTAAPLRDGNNRA
jgi:hypothetical protein